MSRWTDLATWVGHTINEGDGDGTPLEAADRLSDVRGLVLHIASGFYDGTISWQRNASADVSSHFIVGRDGRCAQMVDTADRSWAQRAGNSTWLSVELEGFAPDDPLHKTHPGWERLTDAQVEVCAQLLARAHEVYGATKVPLQLATSPSGRGLGHHSMGAESGVDWGHSQCPGVAIKSQKPAILARAIAIANGEDDMADSPMVEGAAWRLDALATGSETVRGGPTKGEPMQIVKDVHELAAEVTALKATQAAGVDPAALREQLVGALLDPRVREVLVAAANAAEDS